jgi:hypothetical protein
VYGELDVVLKNVLFIAIRVALPTLQKVELAKKNSSRTSNSEITISKSGPNSEIPIVSFELGQEAIGRRRRYKTLKEYQTLDSFSY